MKPTCVLPAALLASVIAATPISAQWSWRAQLAFEDSWRPAALAVAEWRSGGAPPLPDPSSPGPIFATVHDWLLTATAGAGVTVARVGNHDVSPTALAKLGVLRRLGGDLQPRVGLLALGTVHPGAAGPIARFEVRDVAGLEAGWVWFTSGHRNGVVVMLDVSLALIRDLTT